MVGELKAEEENKNDDWTKEHVRNNLNFGKNLLENNWQHGYAEGNNPKLSVQEDVVFILLNCIRPNKLLSKRLSHFSKHDEINHAEAVIAYDCN